jgi:myo-inositol-1(or 4)-monophosphatase
MDCKQVRKLKENLETQIFDIASEATKAAGKELLRVFKTGKLSIERKFDYPGSIVTNADKKAERMIISKIKKSGIPCTIVSEEAGKVNLGSNEIVWAVDPLDGTLNYAKRIPYFAVSVGVLMKSKPMVGAIYNPILDELFVARKDGGAYLNGRRIHVTKSSSLKGASLIFEWWNPEPRIPDPLGLERRLYRFTRSVRSPGSVALNLCAVACGRFDGLVTVFKKSPIYEITAGCLIAEEAGGRVTNSSDESWYKFKGSVLTAGELIHKQLIRMINPS